MKKRKRRRGGGVEIWRSKAEGEQKSDSLLAIESCFNNHQPTRMICHQNHFAPPIDISLSALQKWRIMFLCRKRKRKMVHSWQARKKLNSNSNDNNNHNNKEARVEEEGGKTIRKRTNICLSRWSLAATWVGLVIVLVAFAASSSLLAGGEELKQSGSGSVALSAAALKVEEEEAIESRMPPTSLLSLEATEKGNLPGKLEQIRIRRAAGRGKTADSNSMAGAASTRILAVSGRSVELHCPLANELRALTSSSASSPLPSSSSSSSALISASSDEELAASQQKSAEIGLGHSIVWRKNGARLEQLNPRQKINSNNGSLIINSAQRDLDEGSYECALVEHQDHHQQEHEENTRELKWHRFELRLIVAPKLAPFEFPNSAQVGMKVVLTCSALEGQEPMSFVWLKDNQLIETQAHGSLQNTHNSLSQLHEQQLADKFPPISGTSGGGTSNIGGQKVNEYSLIEQQLSQTATSSLQNSNDKDTADQLLLAASGSSDTPQLLPLLSDSNIRIRQADDYSILSIDKLELKHSGRYTCSVQNEAARSAHSSQLIINAPPTLTVEPKDLDLVSGQSKVIECAASGQPRPTISWLRARESSNKQWDYVAVYDNLRFATLQNGSLAITNVTQREQGYYLCAAKNGFGPEVTKLIKISVHEPAKFASRFKTLEVRVEERASITCAASGEQPITIEWFERDSSKPIEKKDKKFIIDNSPTLDDELSQPETTTPTPNTTISRLILTRSGRQDSGHYTCEASNKFGSDKMVTNLLIQDVPDRIAELKVTNTTASTISLRWQLPFNGNSAVTSYLVQYQSDDPLDDLLLSSAAASINRQLDQPTIGASQQFESLATSGGGGGSSNQTSSLASSLRSALEALNKLSGSPNSNESSSSSSSSNNPSSKSNSPTDSTSLMEEEADLIDRTLVELTVEQSGPHLVVKDLSPFCVYRLRLAAINKLGLGEFSDWIRAKTEEAPPSGVVLRVIASATGPNSVKISWNPPDRRSWNGQLTGFNIRYRPIDSSFELNKSVDWAPPSVVQSMMMLKPAGELTPANPIVKSTGKSRSSSEKESTGGGQQHSQHYLLRQQLKRLLALQQQELVAHLTNLQRSTTYLVWLEALNGRGFGPQTQAIPVRTLDDVPPSAPSLKVQSTTSSSITIGWSMLSNFVSQANQYSLFYRRAPSNHQPQQSSNNFNKSTDNQDHQQQQDNLLLPTESFIERTISSQHLILNSAVNNPAGLSSLQDQQQQLQEVHQSTNNLQLQQQHYQQFVYTLDQLACGSVYELYMTTRNSVGKSEPSPVVTTRTLGEPPLPPINKNSLFTRIAINEAALNLATWSAGGCPISHITVRYKQAPQVAVAAASSSTLATNSTSGNTDPPPPGGASLASSSGTNSAASWPISISLPSNLISKVNQMQLQQHSSRLMTNSYYSQGDTRPAQLEPFIYLLKNLAPSTCYELEVIAQNSAGYTAAQYEFVTASLNGSRASFGRKECGAYRWQNDSANQHFIIEQQQPISFANQVGSANQLLPLLLMTLCLVCLIISSSFCYFRLKDSWRSNGSSNGAGGGKRRNSSAHINGHSSCPVVMSSASVGGTNTETSPSLSLCKSSVWRMGNSSTLKHFNSNQQQQQHHQYRWPPRGELTAEEQQQQQQVEEERANMHYCVRPGESSQQVMSSTLNPKSAQNAFSQSVSMKDFNLVLAPPSDLQNGASSMMSQVGVASGNASTLNLGRHHHYSRTNGLGLQKTSTLRSGVERLFGHHSSAQNESSAYGGGVVLTNHQQTNYANCDHLNNDNLCPAYAATCKQKQPHHQKQQLQQQQRQTSSFTLPPIKNGTEQDVDYNLNQGVSSANTNCNYSARINEQHETSWTKFNNQVKGSTTYAIPVASASSNYSSEHPTSNSNGSSSIYQPESQLYQQEESQAYAADPSTIDACIQQFMSQQQFQQHQQEQQYALIVNMKHENQIDNNRCQVYGVDGNNNNNIYNSNQVPTTRTNANINLPQLNNQHQGSLIDSCSSSSGIGMNCEENNQTLANGNHQTATAAATTTATTLPTTINHLDCGSSATGTLSTNTGSSHSSNGNDSNGYQMSEPNNNNNILIDNHYTNNERNNNNIISQMNCNSNTLEQHPINLGPVNDMIILKQM